MCTCFSDYFGKLASVFSNVPQYWHLLLIAIFAFWYTHRNMLKTMAEKRVESLREALAQVAGLLKRRQSALEKYYDFNTASYAMVENLNKNNQANSPKNEHDAIDEKTRQTILNSLNEVVREIEGKIEYYRTRLRFLFNPEKEVLLLVNLYSRIDTMLSLAPDISDKQETVSEKSKAYQQERATFKREMETYLKNEWDGIQSFGFRSFWVPFLLFSAIFLTVLAAFK